MVRLGRVRRFRLRRVRKRKSESSIKLMKMLKTWKIVARGVAWTCLDAWTTDGPYGLSNTL